MKTVVITGTSRGIGLQLALSFANSGHKVVALSRKPHPDLNAHANISFFSVDLTADDGLQSFADFLQTNPTTIDILIHNAGQLITKPFSQLTNADFESVYKVNVFGVAELTRICLPFMVKGSHMVTISSMGGIQGSMKFPGLAAYSSSKGAVITLTEMLAEEYKDSGISFNVLALGAVQTEMLAEAFPGYQAPVSALEMANYIMDFSLNAQKFYNGKVLQVSASTP
ncbi:SDR family NAD(P)-dependent oxidoreductase [Flavobacterium silvaticum]|uniref:SDR family oxidoreductase n=1 Tax=Flavobacterium silvaticum TaxID=1852020 RepID=A0A972JHW3_9FLAO|nr:SDR family NAD(P)-dependent oxidoreductase [Flavobacterium silvaticum]NMH29651.1 SDR family oxidoreductase [Flavobacterium silvaticum]